MTHTNATSEAGALALSETGLAELLRELARRGHRIIAPTLRDGAIVHDEIIDLADLPVGWTEEQEAGTYRLRPRDDAAYFGYSLGPQSWKQLLFVPRLRLFSARSDEESFEVQAERSSPPRLALIGARSCDLHAIAVQDRTFLQGPYVDEDYRARREALFVVAVQCSQAGGTCFCTSMGTGPRATLGFDLALTELVGEPHRFLVEIGSERGRELLATIPTETATLAEQQRAEALLAATAGSMGRTLDTTGIKELLYRNQEHPRWDDVAERCLACTNCTLVCPTCFCASVEDTSDLAGETAERWRRWDSCFTLGHSELHGGAVRRTIRSRYRQWLTHKLASWIDQFGTSGCVGCGRCITWCPVGIDLTVEVAALREAEPELQHGGPDGDQGSR